MPQIFCIILVPLCGCDTNTVENSSLVRTPGHSGAVGWGQFLTPPSLLGEQYVHRALQCINKRTNYMTTQGGLVYIMLYLQWYVQDRRLSEEGMSLKSD